MSDLARTHWVGDGCVPPHSTEPAVLPPISDSTVTPVASEGTMRLRRERDEARAEVERLRARPYWNGTDAMSPGWEAAVAQVEQLRAAVRAVRRLPQRPWSEAEADGIEALQARAYNSGLNDARHAIDAALEGEL